MKQIDVFRYPDETPLPTPTHKYNPWAGGGRHRGGTGSSMRDSTGGDRSVQSSRRHVGDTPAADEDPELKREWEQEQKRFRRLNSKVLSFVIFANE